MYTGRFVIVNEQTVRVERSFLCSPSRLWKAITDSAELSAWMHYPVSSDAVAGGRINFDFNKTGEDGCGGEILTLDEPKLFEHEFVCGKDTTLPKSICRWEIKRSGKGSKIILTHTHLRPDTVKGLGDGWSAFLDDLSKHLDQVTA